MKTITRAALALALALGTAQCATAAAEIAGYNGVERTQLTPQRSSMT